MQIRTIRGFKPMNKINPNHQKQNSALKVIGPIVLLIGLGFLAVGMISFFNSFGSFGSPRLFWCAFVGMPIMAIGIAMTRFAYMGKIARYTAGELAPVAKDTFNYMAKETQEGISDVAEAIADGTKRSNNLTIEERIQKLEKMKQSGLINEEDFEEQKDRILSEI